MKAKTLSFVVLWTVTVSAGERMSVTVCNLGRLPANAIAHAEQTAARVFGSMGIEIGWKSSEASSVADDWRGGPRFFLRLRRSGQFAGGGAARLETMGMAYLAAGGAGEMADVYYDAIQEFANSYRLEAADEILGYAIAHEFGHLLLGPAHAPAGIMSAVWRSKEWNAIHQGGLKFGKAERAAMQRELRKIEDRARPVSK